MKPEKGFYCLLLVVTPVVCGCSFFIARSSRMDRAAAVVAFRIDDPDAESVVRILESEHGIVIARGQGDLRGRILRISPIGKGPGRLRDFAGAFAATMAEVNRPIDLGQLQHRFEPLLEECAIWE